MKWRQILGTLLVMVCLLAVMAPGVAQAAVAATAKWYGPDTVPSAITYEANPVLATYDGLLYAAWQGQGSPYHIWYSTYNGTTWSAQQEVPNAVTNEYTGPTLAVYDGDLYLAWEGQASPYHIWYSAFNGSTWSNQAEVPSALANASSAVGLAAYNGDLYLAWTGQTSYNVWYSAFNGSSWTAQSTIPSATSSGAFYYVSTPLVSYDGRLYDPRHRRLPDRLLLPHLTCRC
jgi:hypothetical protein